MRLADPAQHQLNWFDNAGCLLLTQKRHDKLRKQKFIRPVSSYNGACSSIHSSESPFAPGGGVRDCEDIQDRVYVPFRSSGFLRVVLGTPRANAQGFWFSLKERRGSNDILNSSNKPS